MKLRLLLALLLASLGGPALADDTAVYGTGGAIHAMDEHPSVVMEEMSVDAQLTTETAEVNCSFVFRNTGGDITVRMGFPESGNVNARPRGFTAFTTSVDDVPVPTSIEGLVEHEGSGVWERWRVKSVTFAPGQTRRVRISYQTPMDQDSVGGRRFEYRIGTGGSWKGPIGRGSVRIRLEGTQDWVLLHDSRLRQAPGDLLEWTATDFEPQDGLLWVRLEPPVWPVYIAGRRETVGQRDLRGGHLWIPAARLAGWVGAEVASDADGITIVRGSRILHLTAKRPWMEVNGQRTALPGAPFRRGPDFVVPMAAVARGLGAQVTYMPHSRTTGISFPLQSALREAVDPLTGNEFFKALAEHARGWAPPDREEFDRDLLDHLYRKGRTYPGMCSGDFNADGKRDVAVLLCKQDRLAVVAVHGTETGPPDVRWLTQWPAVTLLPDRLFFHYLQTRSPGLVEYWTDDAWKAEQKSGRLQLNTDGIELVAWEKAAVMYYWDPQTGGYKRVGTAD
jgi:hypothetical protein